MSVFLRANNDLSITWELSVIVVLYTAYLLFNWNIRFYSKCLYFLWGHNNIDMRRHSFFKPSADQVGRMENKREASVGLNANESTINKLLTKSDNVFSCKSVFFIICFLFEVSFSFQKWGKKCHFIINMKLMWVQSGVIFFLYVCVC